MAKIKLIFDNIYNSVHITFKTLNRMIFFTNYDADDEKNNIASDDDDDDDEDYNTIQTLFTL